MRSGRTTPGLLGVAFLSLALLSPPAGATDPRGEGRELVGTRAPPFELEHWIHSEPIEIDDLAGQVVLVRWWTDTRGRGWTSVSFLVGPDGIIRYVHPGGEFHPGGGGGHWSDHATCNREHDELVALIEQLLPR